MSISRSEVQPAAVPPAMLALLGVTLAHMLNDAMQAVLPASYPLFQQSLHLSFAQIGWVAFALNVTASILQPLIGSITDKKPMPWLLPLGMVCSFLGMIGLAFAPGYGWLLLSAAAVGLGSSVLHPESSRVAHLAAGKRRGLAQSIFQLGGNTGTALAPLAAGFLLLPLGQTGFLWFTLLALLGIAVQWGVGRWYRHRLLNTEKKSKSVDTAAAHTLSSARVTITVGILMLLLFSKFVYLASMTSYYAFYYMDRFHLPLERAQMCLFALQFAGMIGTFLGGPLADRWGRKPVIWFSILGTTPFTLLLPYAGPVGSLFLCMAIGFILMSGFSVIVVYAQELLPGRVGMVSGLSFGFSFGMAGLGAVLLGWMIDWAGLQETIRLCAGLPLLGAAAFFLPGRRKAGTAH